MASTSSARKVQAGDGKLVSIQGGFWDRTVEDEEFAELLSQKHEMDEDEAFRAQKRKFNTLAKRIKGKIQEHNLEDAERLRAGRFIVTGRARQGGGYAIGAWHAVGVARIEPDPDGGQ
jgi:hypothetical protein